jgi:hypothetical protein
MSVCMYVPLHNSGVSRQISDFLVLKIRQKICGATRTKIIELLKIMKLFLFSDRQTKWHGFFLLRMRLLASPFGLAMISFT